MRFIGVSVVIFVVNGMCPARHYIPLRRAGISPSEEGWLPANTQPRTTTRNAGQVELCGLKLGG
jgi:hypothetical protein